jgi:CRP-like cAMP-binding protein
MSKNAIFSLLHARHADFLARFAMPVVFGAGAVVRGPQAQSSDVIFPETGLIAVLTPLEDGQVIEVGMVGQSGASVSNSLFSVNAVDDAEIAVTDVAGWSIKPADLATILDMDAKARFAFSRNGEFLLRQSRQLAACHAWHPLDQRLATWLLRASEIGQTRAFQLTQKKIANFLGVSHASLSTAAFKLLRLGAVDYTKGRLRILDSTTLAARACSCQRVLHENQRSLLRLHDFDGQPI